MHLVAHIYAKLIESSCWCAIDASPHRPTIISLTQLNSHRIHRNVWRAKRNVQTRFPSNYQKYELKLNYSESFTLHSRTKILHSKHSPHMILIYMFHIVTKKTNINFITLYCYLINSLSLSLCYPALILCTNNHNCWAVRAWQCATDDTKLMWLA